MVFRFFLHKEKNNSYSSLTAFKDDAEIADYLRKLKLMELNP
ncbi:hypothetical protein PR261_03095 [Metamycoplasma hyosynoviae]|nr:hypothetical protein [Metamycoplasma hyosynoviae]MDC8918018.1 hypothetical protein [Metamycoplasma hyosynoviae]